jgi:hypothetical protein
LPGLASFVRARPAAVVGAEHGVNLIGNTDKPLFLAKRTTEVPVNAGCLEILKASGVAGSGEPQGKLAVGTEVDRRTLQAMTAARRRQDQRGA